VIGRAPGHRRRGGGGRSSGGFRAGAKTKKPPTASTKRRGQRPGNLAIVPAYGRPLPISLSQPGCETEPVQRKPLARNRTPGGERRILWFPTVQLSRIMAVRVRPGSKEKPPAASETAPGVRVTRRSPTNHATCPGLWRLCEGTGGKEKPQAVRGPRDEKVRMNNRFSRCNLRASHPGAVLVP
jgi:hypothetical protein